MQPPLQRRGKLIRPAFATAILVILAVATASPRTFGQTAPATDPFLTDGRGDSQPLLAETTFGQPCSSRWTAAADFIILERIGSVSYTLVETVPRSVKYRGSAQDYPGTEVLNATDLQQGFSAGPQFALTHHGDDGNDLEVSYFQIDGWDDTKSVGPIIGPEAGPIGL